MDGNIIEIKGLEKSYDGFHLGPIDMSVPYGAVTGFIGENGAGKSTTIKLMIGAIKRGAGEIKLFGQPVTGGSADIELKQRIGVVLGEGCFHPNLTPENIDRILAPIYRKWDSKRYFELLEQFGLSAKKTVKEMSRGMKMKLALAAALSHDAELLILDEPTSGLDPVVRDELLDVFLDFVRDDRRSILISSHITSDLEKAADYITFIHKGQIVLTDERDAMLERMCILKCPLDDVASLPQDMIMGIRRNSFGAQVLIDRAGVPSGGVVDHATLEDIMLYTIRGEKQ